MKKLLLLLLLPLILLIPGINRVQADTYLGGMDLNGYCQSIGQTQAYDLNGNTWVCQPSNNPIDMNAVCRYQYNPSAYAVLQGANWLCYQGTTSPSPTPTPTPSPTPSWNLQSVDVMKYTKDVVCGQPTQATIDTMVQKAVDLGANYVAISTPYDNPSCGNSLTLTTNWVNSIRSHGLNVWHRHSALAFEGLYGVTKSRDKDFLTIMSNYITQNPTLFKAGDIFTPFPEPDSQGINGVTYCNNGLCQFQNTADFNQFIRDATLVANLSFQKIGLGGQVKIGYWGFSGFTVFGDANSYWLGKSQLEPSTVALMGNITMDEYPQGNNESMATALQGYDQAFPNTPLVIGEWGTIDATSSAQAVSEINTTYSTLKSAPNVIGVNYWNLGPAGNESLLDSSFNNLPGFSAVQSFFK